MRAVIAVAFLCLVAACGPAPSPSPGDPGRGRHAVCAAVLRRRTGAGPGITINAEVRSCFLGGYQDGSGGEFASIMTSMEGDPIATIWRTIPGGGVEMLIDATQDKFGSGGWSRTVCRQLVSDPQEVFIANGCAEGVAVQ